MCARKGFDAVGPDIDDSWTDSTGFGITEADKVAYDVRLADYARAPRVLPQRHPVRVRCGSTPPWAGLSACLAPDPRIFHMN